MKKSCIIVIPVKTLIQKIITPHRFPISDRGRWNTSQTEIFRISMLRPSGHKKKICFYFVVSIKIKLWRVRAYVNFPSIFFQQNDDSSNDLSVKCVCKREKNVNIKPRYMRLTVGRPMLQNVGRAQDGKG